MAAKKEILKSSLTEISEADSTSPLQVVAGNMSRWMLMFAIGMGVLGAASIYLELLVVASALVSIVLVSLTLYLFLRLWPEDQKAKSIEETIAQIESKPRRRAMVKAFRRDGPPRARFVMAIRDMVRKQETFKISQQGAEIFAKTIRHILRSER